MEQTLVDADELIGWGVGLGFEGEERWGRSPLEAALKSYLESTSLLQALVPAWNPEDEKS